MKAKGKKAFQEVLMRNSVQLDQHHKVSSLQIAEVDQIQEQEGDLLRLQMMEQETTDPLAARLLQDIISQMEADLKEQVERLVAEQRYEHH
jgi:hypothetical protein